MTEEELIKFLKENLSIRLTQSRYYGTEVIEVEIYLNQTKICEDRCDLPEKD